MRISDWSSDVCSSDLSSSAPRISFARSQRLASVTSAAWALLVERGWRHSWRHGGQVLAQFAVQPRACGTPVAGDGTPGDAQCICGFIRRSEEHTSELQSLMRISYDVFYLTK